MAIAHIGVHLEPQLVYMSLAIEPVSTPLCSRLVKKRQLPRSERGLVIRWVGGHKGAVLAITAIAPARHFHTRPRRRQLGLCDRLRSDTFHAFHSIQS